jgi:predicted O-methyltransferase YrrM
MKLRFGKNEHIRMIKEIAIGLNRAGVLNRYLELGFSKGVCFNAVAPLAKESYTVDINNIYFGKNTKNIFYYRGTTTAFLENHDKYMKFDLVFIDADHKHESSLSDFKLVLPLVNDNGIILLHDTYPTSEPLTTKSYCYDTYKTADYIRKNYTDICEICTLPFYFGISIVRKLDRQLLWRDIPDVENSL